MLVAITGPATYFLTDGVYLSGMKLHITDILREGIRRSVSRNGLLLMGVLFVLLAVNELVGIGVESWISLQQFDPNNLGSILAFAVPPVTGGLVSLLLALAALVVSIAAIRAFVSPETERLPREYFTENMLWVAVNMFVGTIAFAIVVALGFVFLVIPGIFLLVTLIFWSVYVSVEGTSFVKGFQRSWGLTRGYRLELFVLGLGVFVLMALVNLVFSVGGFAGGVIEVVFVQAASAITTIFSTAVLATAYNELAAQREETGGMNVDESDVPPTAPAEAV